MKETLAEADMHVIVAPSSVVSVPEDLPVVERAIRRVGAAPC